MDLGKKVKVLLSGMLIGSTLNCGAPQIGMPSFHEDRNEVQRRVNSSSNYVVVYNSNQQFLRVYNSRSEVADQYGDSANGGLFVCQFNGPEPQNCWEINDNPSDLENGWREVSIPEGLGYSIFQTSDDQANL